nr:unnamed protein product [Digitaria exilis]
MAGGQEHSYSGGLTASVVAICLMAASCGLVYGYQVGVAGVTPPPLTTPLRRIRAPTPSALTASMMVPSWVEQVHRCADSPPPLPSSGQPRADAVEVVLATPSLSPRCAPTPTIPETNGRAPSARGLDLAAGRPPTSHRVLFPTLLNHSFLAPATGPSQPPSSTTRPPPPPPCLVALEITTSPVVTPAIALSPTAKKSSPATQTSETHRHPQPAATPAASHPAHNPSELGNRLSHRHRRQGGR